MNATRRIGVAFALVGAFGAGVGLGPDIRGDAGPRECTSAELRSLEYKTRLTKAESAKISAELEKKTLDALKAGNEATADRLNNPRPLKP